MSSLQKFHRRTQSLGPAAPVLGSGSSTKGYYLGLAGDGISYMYVAPKSTDSQMKFGGYGGNSYGTSSSDGLGNTNRMYVSPSTYVAAAYAKNLTTGGYNTWYLPAKDELVTCWSNHALTPFATTDGFSAAEYWTSTDTSSTAAWFINFSNGSMPGYTGNIKNNLYYVRAVRRSLN